MLALPVVFHAEQPTRQAPALFSVFPVIPRWSATIESGLDGRPAFDGARAFVPRSGGTLSAYDLMAGAELWTVEQPPAVAMTAADGRVFHFTPERLVALDAESGRTLWQIPLETALTAPPVANAGWLVVGSGRTVTAIRAEDGVVLWSQTVPGTVIQAPAILGPRIYVALDEGWLVSLRIQNGTQVWERRLGGSPQPVVAFGERLYVGATDNFFYCVRAVDGEIRWRWRTGADIVGAAVHDEARVYFVSMDNVLRALDAGTGAQRWKKPLPLRPTAGPVLVNDVLLLAGLGSSVLGFQLKDGSSAGEFDAGGLLAAPTHVVSAPTLLAPLLVSIARSPTAGTKMTALTRDFEPPARPVVPLPNAAPIERLPGGNPEPPASEVPPVPEEADPRVETKERER